MAIRTWSRSLLVALGVSLLAGAGQLGIAYGLGLLRFTRSFADAPDHWPAQLVWVGWFAVGATLAGAVLADRYARRRGLPVTGVVQASIVVAATLGATVVAPLCMLPARNAQVPSVEPVLAVAVSALFATLAGAVAAVAALRYAPVAWNVAVTTGLVWLVALLSVVPSLGSADPLPTVRLGALDPDWLAPAAAGRLAALLLPGLALLVGAAVAGVARRRGQPLLTGAVSGVAAPLLVTVAYLLAGPGPGDAGYQSTPYRAALVAVLTGALGAVAATLLRPPSFATARRPSLAATLFRWPSPARGRTRTGAIEPTEILRPLPVDAGAPHVPSPSRPADDLDRSDPGTESSSAPAGTDSEHRPLAPPPAEPGPTPPPVDADPAATSSEVPPGPDAPERSGPDTPERSGPDTPERSGPDADRPGGDPGPGTGQDDSGRVTGHAGSATAAGDGSRAASDGTGPQPIGRLAWRFPQDDDTDWSPSGALDWPRTPGTAQSVSTGSLDWSLPGPAHNTGPAQHTGGPATTGDPLTDAPAPAGTDPAVGTPVGGSPTAGAHPATGGPTDDPTDAAPVTGIGAAGDHDVATGPTRPGGAADDGGDTPGSGGLRRLRGLLRRDRSRADAERESGRDREASALPPQDEEYVDWVAQLGQPTPDAAAPGEPGDRRTLRSPGRHHRD